MRRILLSIVAILVVAGLRAQSYNIVITTSNGTTISLSANDIRNISFNNGQLVISGSDISQFATQQKLDSITKVTSDQLMQLRNMADYAYDRYKVTETMLYDSVKALRETIGNISIGSSTDSTSYLSLRADLSVLQSSMQSLQAQIAAVQTEVQNAEASSALKSDVVALQSQLSSVSANVQTLQANVANNTAQIQSEQTMRENNDNELTSTLRSLVEEINNLAARISALETNTSDSKAVR